MANLEREMEEALGLPPRPKYVSTAVQDTANLLDKEIAEAKTAGISQESPTLSDLGNIVIDFTPVIGDIKGGIEGAELIFEELKKEEPNYVLIGVVGGAGVLGLIPGIGDGAQKLIMKGAKRFRKKELSPELMESLTLKEKEIVEDLNKKTVEKPNTKGEEIADFIAESLRNNKLEYITDDILTGLGNDGHRRLTQHYIDGNVGMDLPMDFESTMARAADQGFTELRYHGSNIKDLDFFLGQGEKRGAGMFNSPDVFKALTYETPNGQTYSLLMRPLPENTPKVDVEGATWGNLDEPSIEYNRNKLSPDVRTGPRMDRVAQPLDTFVPRASANITTDMFMREASDLGYPGATIENVVDRGPYTPQNLSLKEGQNIRTKASMPSETQARTDTTGIRTLFGRFDPRLQNLKNINMYQGGLASTDDQMENAFKDTTTPLDEIKEAEINRQKQMKSLGNLEYTADFQELLENDYIARLGFDPDKITIVNNDRIRNAGYNPVSQKLFSMPQKMGNRVIPPDEIGIYTGAASDKPVALHEFRHRGYDKLVGAVYDDTFDEEKNEEEFVKKYGVEAAGILQGLKSGGGIGYIIYGPIQEMAAEIFDKGTIGSKYRGNRPVDQPVRGSKVHVYKKGTPYAQSEGLETIKPEIISDFQKYLKDPTSLTNPQESLGVNYLDKSGNKIPLNKEQLFKGFANLNRAAKDLLDKQKGFNKGGMAMNDQTQMAFALGGEAETVDPVSGNDVPPGSLPEEVRDDIDARLSEGEYVVPADVVRFFGVKFFEDLRTQAKMGLQQMDADGRIGGDPIPSEDSMDVAELKAELSKSDMYAGGLTDGGGLDTFIDDASRSPMVNGRMRANGATVKMAVGGLAVGNYGDVTKVDGIIQKLMTAANKDPALMEKLASKGIMINKTGADKKSAEMKQANKPEEPLKAAEGVSVQPDPFDFDSYGTLGGNLFKSAGIKDPNKTIADTFLKEEGTIEQIVLIAPDGTEIPVAWNTAMPIPKGFTKKATNEYGAAPTANVTSGIPVAISTQDTRQRKTGDDGDNGGGDPPPTATPFDYRGSTPEQLADKYRQVKTFSNIGRVASVAAGPLGVIIGIGARINHDIVMRRIEQELDRRIEEKEIKPEDVLKNPKGKIDTIEKLIKQVDTENVRGKGFIGSFLAPAVDSFFDKMATTAAEKQQKSLEMQPLKGSGFEDSGLPAAFSDSFLSRKDSTGETGLAKVERLKREQEAATASRLERERKEREAREAAQRAASATAARNSAEQREIDRINRENRDDSDPFSFDIGSDPSFTSGDGDYNPPATFGSISSGGLYQEGGLVSMPAAKKQKKRKTQRRKGLGTRP